MTNPNSQTIFVLKVGLLGQNLINSSMENKRQIDPLRNGIVRNPLMPLIEI